MEFTHCQAVGCGRALTNPKSRARGYGRNCWRERNPARPRRSAAASRGARRLPAVPAAPVPGQTEIPLPNETLKDGE